MPSLLRGLPTNDPRQPLRVSQTLLALGIYVVCAVGQHLEVMLGLIDERASWWLTVWNLSGGVAFFVATWAGLNVRWNASRAFALAQSTWAMTSVAWSYAITGPARGAILMLVALIMFFAMFTMKTHHTRRIALLAILMMGGVMLGKALTDPGRYDPRVEVIHFLFFVIVMVSCAMLSIRIGTLRAKLEKQGTELSAALARIQALATRDELTGLLNRRAALEVLHGQLGDRGRDRPRLTVALIDLDHFKRINDLHGHVAGDTVLRRFAEVAGAEVREGDALARWGGEEFLLMMPGATVEQGHRVLARIRDRLKAASMEDVAAGLVVTFSAGLATCDDEGGLEPAIEAADRALYAAKAAGRDRSVSASDCDTLAVSAG